MYRLLSEYNHRHSGRKEVALLYSFAAALEMAQQFHKDSKNTFSVDKHVINWLQVSCVKWTTINTCGMEDLSSHQMTQKNEAVITCRIAYLYPCVCSHNHIWECVWEHFLPSVWLLAHQSVMLWDSIVLHKCKWESQSTVLSASFISRKIYFFLLFRFYFTLYISFCTNGGLEIAENRECGLAGIKVTGTVNR